MFDDVKRKLSGAPAKTKKTEKKPVKKAPEKKAAPKKPENK
jgi:hypothetical protein